MKKVLFILITLITLSCSKEINSDEGVDLNDFYTSITKDGKSRIVEWKKLSLTQKHSIWKQRFNEIIETIDEIEKRKAIEYFTKNSLTIENYTSLDKMEIEYSKFLESHNGLFSTQELHYIFETLDPFSKNLNYSLDILPRKKRNTSSQRWTEPVGSTTFHNSDCDCNWGDCGGFFNDATECCDKGGCAETSNGCGLMWLGQCKSICILTYEYEC